MLGHSEGFFWTRELFLRGLAFIYLIGFVNIVNQWRGLLGACGLLPVRLFVARAPFKAVPSLFFWRCDDRFCLFCGWIGVLLALLALLGVPDRLGFGAMVAVWGGLWLLYLSFVNTGQIFYGFGWESLLLETGFMALFAGPSDSEAPAILMWLARWTLFRLMFGAGLIKLRGDRCWKELTCMDYHYETQPLPNPLSWYLHRLPKLWHKIEVLFNHFVELVVPWGFFLPPPLCYVAGALTALFQCLLILSGNLSWLNYLSLVLCIACFDDGFWSYIFGGWPDAYAPMGWAHLTALAAYTILVAGLSFQPIMNMISRRQTMNRSFEPFHLCNTYGAFGSITKRRFEIIVQGSDDGVEWREYEFKAKPGAVGRRPAVVAPYHLRLDWLMWFAAMSDYTSHPWLVHFVAKLLEGDREVRKLIAYDPFEGRAPRWVRCDLYLYRFSKPADKTKDWWRRSYSGEYLPALSVDDPALQRYLVGFGWEESQG